VNEIEKTEVGANTVRAWARENGFEVGTRGHLSNDLVNAFNRRHRKQRFTNKNPMVTR
jgi:hypothetical protein